MMVVDILAYSHVVNELCCHCIHGGSDYISHYIYYIILVAELVVANWTVSLVAFPLDF